MGEQRDDMLPEATLSGDGLIVGGQRFSAMWIGDETEIEHQGDDAATLTIKVHVGSLEIDLASMLPHCRVVETWHGKSANRTWYGQERR